jgi:DNA-binding SARP family transcriptional activator
MAIARLRRALEPLSHNGEPRLRTVSGGYMITLQPSELDADAFTRLVEDGRSALDAGTPAKAAELLSAGLGLWRGPPLADVGFEDFAQPEIRRLEELRLLALESRTDAELQLGRHAQLVGELEGLLTEHPARERMASQLMLALYRCGRQGDALEVYQRTRGHRGSELGLEPGPALKALQAQILEQSPSLALGDDGAGADRPGRCRQDAACARSCARGSGVRPAALEELTALLTRSGNYRQLEVANNNCADMAMKEGRIDEALHLLETAETAAAKASTP